MGQQSGDVQSGHEQVKWPAWAQADRWKWGKNRQMDWEIREDSRMEEELSKQKSESGR